MDEVKEHLEFTRIMQLLEYYYEQYEKLLGAIPECNLHGRCAPHAYKWIEEAKAVMEDYQRELATARYEAEVTLADYLDPEGKSWACNGCGRTVPLSMVVPNTGNCFRCEGLGVKVQFTRKKIEQHFRSVLNWPQQPGEPELTEAPSKIWIHFNSDDTYQLVDVEKFWTRDAPGYKIYCFQVVTDRKVEPVVGSPLTVYEISTWGRMYQEVIENEKTPDAGQENLPEAGPDSLLQVV